MTKVSSNRAEVSSGDILENYAKGETELSAEEKLLRAIFVKS